MAQKTVLVVEDKSIIRHELEEGLRRHGMHVIVAGTADEAREQIKSVPDVDVVVLDIVLENDTTNKVENGFDFGFHLKSKSEWSPEFLIHTAHDHVDYWQAALKLGAAAYLKKGSVSSIAVPRVEIVAQHVRALALRRALQSPKMSGRLQGLVKRSVSADEAIELFCREILSEELKATVGTDFVILLTRAGGTVAVSGRGALLHASAETLQQLQDAVYARLDAEPYIVNARDTLSPSAHERDVVQRVLGSMSGAAFVELGEIECARLSIGLIPGPKQSSDAVKEQVKLIDRYLQKPLILQLLAIIGKWAELDLERRLEIHRREVLLDATGKFCLYEAGELTYALRDSEGDERSKQLSVKIDKLKAIADELREAGEVLGYFAPSSERPRRAQTNDVAEIVEKVWSDEVSPVLRLSQPPMLKIVGHCETSDDRERAARTVAQILGWMARRLTRPEGESDRVLLVECHSADGGQRVQVTFEEHSSRRVTQRLRESFFEPFYSGFADEPGDDVADGGGGRRLGLYLAKTLADLAGGVLKDRSDELGGTVGHKFVLELPAAVSYV